MFNHPNNSKNSKDLLSSNQSRVQRSDNPSYEFISKPVSNSYCKDECVVAMVEDLCDWLNFLYKLDDDNKIVSSRFFSQLQDGVILNKHANSVQYLAEIYLKIRNNSSRDLPLKCGNRFIKVPMNPPKYVVKDFTLPINSFHKRDNVANFIHWCNDFNIPSDLTFESEDLILVKHPRNVVLCLLEVARIGKLFGMEVPDIIQLEEEIDNELINQVVKNDEGVEKKINDNIVTEINENLIAEFPVDLLNVTIRKKPRHNAITESQEENEREVIDFSKVTMRKKPKQCDIGNSNVDRDSENLMQKIDYCDTIVRNVKSTNVELNSHFGNRTQELGFQSVGQIEYSDSDSASSSGTPFSIPKFRAFKPVGRVKIYDCFDQSNLVKEKKYREKCDLRSLDERVREILSECQCTETFPMKRISEGKYQWGDKKTHIFIRILRSHVMVRVGGGWDTLNEFLRKHDHCRKNRGDYQRPPFVASANKNVKANFYSEVQNQKTDSELKSSISNYDFRRRHSMFTAHENTTNPQSSDGRPMTLTVSYSNNNFKTSKKELLESNSHQMSSDCSNSSLFLLANEISNTDKSTTDSQSAICTQDRIPNIHSNQKHFSRIPILKKR